MQQESQSLWRGWEVGKDLHYGAACSEGVVQRSNGRNALETVTDLASQRSSAILGRTETVGRRALIACGERPTHLANSFDLVTVQLD
jgi:hypothetical protein